MRAEEVVFEALGDRELSETQIALQAGLSLGEVARALDGLRLARRVRLLEGTRLRIWRRA